MGNIVRSNKLFSQANFYTAVCFLFFLRKMLFGAFSFFGRVFFVMFFILSVYYFFKTIIEYKLPTCLKMLSFCLVLIVSYGSLLALMGIDIMWGRSADRYFYLIIHLQSILPIYAFYYFAKKQLIDDGWFRKIFVLFFVFTFIIFRNAQMIKLEAQGTEETVVNEAYGFLALFPIMVFFQKKPIIQYFGLLLILFFLLSGFKRGAIILGGICFLVFLWHSLRSTKESRKIITIVIAGVLLYVVVQYVDDLLQNSNLFNMRLEKTLDGDSSGRDDIYSKYWSFFWNQDSALAILFGNGAYGTLKHLGLMAHNDWLEFLIDMGLFGTLVYIVYWVTITNMCIKSYKTCSREIFLGILLWAIINLGRSIFSTSIMDMSLCSTSVFGYLVAQYDNSLRKSLSI